MYTQKIDRALVNAFFYLFFWLISKRFIESKGDAKLKLIVKKPKIKEGRGVQKRHSCR
jgi:hypothetical protein